MPAKDYEQRPIRKGVSIIRQPSKSPFWQARWWDNAAKRYVVKSTKEESAPLAKSEAEILIKEYFKNPLPLAQEKPKHLFRVFAERLDKINASAGKGFVQRDDAQILFREDDGLVPYFGEKDITRITGSDIRDYLSHLNNNRDDALSASTQKKQIITLRKVFKLAAESNVISALPVFPVVSQEDRPRVSFSRAEWRAVLATIRQVAKEGATKIEGVLLDREFYNFCVFLTNAFARPTVSEIFALKHTDVEELEKGLRLTIQDGKTGFRYSTTMPVAQVMYRKQKQKYANVKPGDYIFYPGIKNRKDALAKVRKMFNVILEKAELKYNSAGEPRSLYSCRHYAIQQRIINSGGKINLVYLAQTSGNSVEVLTRFYLKFLPHTQEVVDNIQYMEPKKKGA